MKGREEDKTNRIYTSLDPRPKPLIMGPERRIGKGGSGPAGGPAKAGRSLLGGGRVPWDADRGAEAGPGGGEEGAIAGEGGRRGKSNFRHYVRKYGLTTPYSVHTN